MTSTNERRFRLRRSRVPQTDNGRRASRLLGLAAAALMSLLLPASASAVIPQNWTYVAGPQITVTGGMDGFTQATCPAGTVPQGGGAFVGDGVHSNLNSTYPDPNGVSWDANVNQSDASGSTGANVDLICAQPNTGYTQVASASTANPAGTTTTGTANCPAGTNVLGGGVKPSSQDVNVNLNSTYPTSPTSWQASVANASASAESFTVYVVCSAPFDGYGIIVGQSTTQGPNSQNRAAASCPGGETLGGGVSASSSDLNVNISADDPRHDSENWVIWQNDSSATATDTFTAYVVCANIPPPPPPPVRPRGATPLAVPLVPAYRSCSATSATTTHGAPLSFKSCAPPVQSSPYLTLGTPDAPGNGAAANGVASVRYSVQVNAEPPPDDVRIDVSTTDVRCQPVETACGSANAAGTGADYTGQLQLVQTLRITDRLNGPSQTEQGTVQDVPFRVTIPCAATADTSFGSTCQINLSANAVLPGSGESELAIWELGQVQVFDGGVQGTAGASDATLFEDQGVFVP
jgi:hypothetical protein